MEESDLRSAVMDENIAVNLDYSEKASGDIEEFRKAVIEQKSSIFRMATNENLRQAVIEKNLHSLFRLVDDEDLRKLILEDNVWKCNFVRKKIYLNTIPHHAFKDLFRNNVDFDKDCFSRGQLQSKMWLVDELKHRIETRNSIFMCRMVWHTCNYDI